MKKHKIALTITALLILVFICVIVTMVFEIVLLLPKKQIEEIGQNIIQENITEDTATNKTFLMPDIVGKSVQEAELALSNTKFLTVEKRYVFHDSIAQGVVISQNIAAKQELNNETTVILYVSMGNTSGIKKYTKKNNTVTINKWDTAATGEIIVPYEIEGCVVTEIASKAFWGCENITSVILPDGVEQIGNMAFWLCKRLEEINIPPKVTEIATNTFTECAFTEIILPEGVLTVGNSAYADCFNVKRIQLPNTLKRIEEHAFSYCRKVTEIIIPDSVEYIHKEGLPDTIRTVYFSSEETKQRFAHLFGEATLIIR